MGLAAFSIRNAKFVWFTVIMLTLGGSFSVL